MIKKFDYTKNVRKVAFSHPLVDMILTQVYFWVVAYFLFALIIQLFTQTLIEGTDIQQIRQPLPFFISTFFVALIFGISNGFSEYYLFNKKTSTRSLGLVIIGRGMFYAMVMTLLIILMRFFFWDLVTRATYYQNLNHLMTPRAWTHMYFTLLIYTLSMGIVISFIIQMKNKFGPGLLVPTLLGKYINPKVEDRIILFLDLKSSTAIAENLGHIKYSKLIRDCFIDINNVSKKYFAEIYQYVGDEVVVTWLSKDLNNAISAIDYCFACNDLIIAKTDYYQKEYNLLPLFKAGIHRGKITAVEVGSIKREIAYHGDPMNVTSRIQEKCNKLNSRLIISEYLEQSIDWKQSGYTKQKHSAVNLKGRKKPLTVYSISRNSKTN